MEINELNKNANGGTELVTRGLLERTDPAKWEKVQLITSRVRKLENKKRIIHFHDLAGDPEVNHLRDVNQRKRFDAFVFCSNWQYQQYRDYLGVEWSGQSVVIPNAIEPLEFQPRSTEQIRLIYASTPHRGLELLVPVFKFLYDKYGDKIHLDVFSSFNIYGWPERDAPYEKLFEECRQHPGITYHGFQPNAVVRTAMEKAHILAYPSIWQETFCITLAEAMSAGCTCVHSDLAALPETSGGLTAMYAGDRDHNVHANIFAKMLDFTIEKSLVDPNNQTREYIKGYADIRFAWHNVLPRWNALLDGLNSA